MRNRLLPQAIIKFSAGVVLVGLLLFLPAGTLRYPGGLLLMGVLFLPMFCAGVFMLWKAPELLEKRLRMKEREQEQKQVVALSGLMFLAGFVTAGLDFRFGWSRLPEWLSWAAAARLA